MRKDSVNQDKATFKKAHYELTGEEILEHSVMTLKKMLRENQINAYIKLQIRA
ncbi:MAG: hypothetical protein II929_08145 [Succinivibrio sp.]|nr:hypothetical protein [Succinivibrio sp.]